MLRRFFDPHPGFLGAAIGLPITLKEIAKKLDDQVMSLDGAIENFQNAAKLLPIKVKIKDQGDWISATLKKDGCIHIWRLLRHEAINNV